MERALLSRGITWGQVHESVEPGFNLPVIHHLSDHSWGNRGSERLRVAKIPHAAKSGPDIQFL